MKDNRLIKNTEQFAVDIESLCKTLKHKGNKKIEVQL